MRGRDIYIGVAVVVLGSLAVSFMTGIGLVDKAKELGDFVRGKDSDSDGSSPPATDHSAADPVEPVEAIGLVKVYLTALGNRDYEAAWSMYSTDHQETIRRRDFEKFWDGIALMGFVPDEAGSLENFKRHEDGTISITLTLFYDRCDNGKRSVEHDTFLIMRAGDALRIDEYLPKGDAELSTDTVAPEVISSHCQQ